MSTTANVPESAPAAGGAYVTRESCEATHGQERAANERTWEEIRGLRRLVIGLVVGGQLFTGGLNLAGLGYWLQQHAAQPHAATLDLVAAARAESREDLRDLRREVREATARVGPAVGPRPVEPRLAEPRP